MHSEEFKAAVGKFATGVTVITTNQSNRLWGFTANTFVSVSLEPPLISFCLNKQAGSFNAFKSSKYFSINILASNQAPIARNFAKNLADKFTEVDYFIGTISNSPLIKGAVSHIECKMKQQFECGDHYIFVGQVEKTAIDNKKSPLLYFAKSYRELS